MTHATLSRNLFVGRSAELSRLDALLSPGAVIAVRGPAGVGKSRLLHTWLAAHPSHLHVDLSQARDTPHALELLFEALDLTPAPHDTEALLVERVIDTLASRHIPLLLLDHIDQVHPVAALFARAPRRDLTLVLAARRALTLPDTQLLLLDPLPLPEARALFEARARQVRPEIELAPATVDALVTRLDRLPLALELAAARTRIMSVEALLERLDRPLELLRDVHGTFAQTQSLTHALSWSWELLDEVERDALSQLSVFPGDFSLEEAEAVARLDPFALLDALDAVVGHGWLTTREQAGSGELRFGWLEVVRAFAQAHLERSDPRGESHLAHARHLLAQARHHDQRVCTAAGEDALEALSALMPRLHAALRALRFIGASLAAELLLCFGWLLQLELPAELALSLCAQLANDPSFDLEPPLWQRLQLLTAALEWRLGRASQALARLSALLPELEDAARRAEAHRLLGMILSARDPERALEALEQGLELAREARDEVIEARVHERLGFYWMARFELEAARQSFERALLHWRTRGNAWFRAAPLLGLAFVDLRIGRSEDAMGAFLRAREAWGDRRVMPAAQAKFNLGSSLLDAGQLEQARHELEQAAQDFQWLGVPLAQLATTRTLALLHLDAGELAQARQALEQALALAHALSRPHDIALSQGWLAALELAQDRPTVALSLLQERAEAIQVHLDPLAAMAHLTLLAMARAQLGQHEEATPHLDEIRLITDTLAPGDRLWRQVAGKMHALGEGARLLARWQTRGDVTRPQLDAALAPLQLAAQMPSPQELDAMEHVMLRLLARALMSLLGGLDISLEARATLCTLRVHAQGEWFELDGGERVDLSTRRPLRLLLLGLVERHVRDQHGGLSMQEMLAAGWPGEQVSHAAGSNRVYTAVRYLRDYGLEDVLVTSDRGYHFAPGVLVRVVGQGAAKTNTP